MLTLSVITEAVCVDSASISKAAFVVKFLGMM